VRVQRAPRAAEQPQRPPEDYQRGRRNAPAPDGVVASFSADIDLDLTGLLKRLDESQVVAEVIAGLVSACHQEGVIAAESAMRLVSSTDDGLVGVTLDQAVNQSTYAIGSGLASQSAELPPATPRTLTVVRLQGSRARAVGDWGLGGLGVATLGPIVTAVVSVEQATGAGRAITERRLARLSLSVSDARTQAHGAVRALDAVAHSIADLDR
jgi:hypothetical protein